MTKPFAPVATEPSISNVYNPLGLTLHFRVFDSGFGPGTTTGVAPRHPDPNLRMIRIDDGGYLVAIPWQRLTYTGTKAADV